MIKQRTIKQSVQETGIGLHKGDKVTMTLRPRRAIQVSYFAALILSLMQIFRPARMRLAILCYVLVSAMSKVRLSLRVEPFKPLLLAGLGIDNIIVEVDSNELPIMMAAPVRLYSCCSQQGIEELNAAKRLSKS